MVSHVRTEVATPRREIRIFDCQLPETALSAIHKGGLRVRDVVADDVLGRVESVVTSARNGDRCVFLLLQEGWTLLGTPPAGTEEWRTTR